MKCPSKRKRKVNVQKNSAADMKDMDIGEDYLIDLISKKDKKVIGNICRSIGLSARGSSLDMLNSWIRTELTDKKKNMTKCSKRFGVQQVDLQLEHVCME